MLKDFKAFISRGNVVDLAVGIIIGAAFGAIVSSFVNDIIMPPIGLLLGNVDFSSLFLVLKQGATPGPYSTVALAKAAGAVTINYGVFIMTIINFLIIALAVFLVVRAYSNLQRKPAVVPGPPTTKNCPFCFTTIPIKATRCPNCTSELTK
jgi:large conductance mechanosensitive channel